MDNLVSSRNMAATDNRNSRRTSPEEATANPRSSRATANRRRSKVVTVNRRRSRAPDMDNLARSRVAMASRALPSISKVGTVNRSSRAGTVSRSSRVVMASRSSRAATANRAHRPATASRRASRATGSSRRVVVSVVRCRVRSARCRPECPEWATAARPTGAKPTMRNAFVVGLLPEIILGIMPTIFGIVASATGIYAIAYVGQLVDLVVIVWWLLNMMKGLDEMRNAGGQPVVPALARVHPHLQPDSTG
jgi:hypothetical protein